MFRKMECTICRWNYLAEKRDIGVEGEEENLYARVSGSFGRRGN